MTADASVQNLPSVDEVLGRKAVYYADHERISYSLPLATFCHTASVEGLQPIIVTSPHAKMTPHAAFELGAIGARWVVRRPDGSMFDVLQWREISSLEDYELGFDFAELPEAPEINSGETDSLAALSVEVLAVHRTSSDLRVGELAEEVLGSINDSVPEVWGDTEPLGQLWNRTHITAAARAMMPESARIRFACASGASGSLRYSRSPDGVSERLRATVPLGPYLDHATTAAGEASEVLRLASEQNLLVFGHVSLIDMDPGPTQTVRWRRPDVIQSLLLGPWTLRAVKADVASMVENHGGELLGPPNRPSVLFSFDQLSTPPWFQFAELAHDVGLENIRKTLWADGGS